jgi:hypothetical protein
MAYVQELELLGVWAAAVALLVGLSQRLRQEPQVVAVPVKVRNNPERRN